MRNDLDLLLETSKKNMKGCHPKLQEKVLSIIRDLYCLEGVRFAVHMGLRTREQQLALYAQGRESLASVNRRRKSAGYYPISAAANKSRVTGVRFSWHNTGLAVDIVEDGDPNKAGIQWSWRSIKSYLKIGQYAKKYGLEWGGFWKSFKDYPHLQYPVPLSLRQAANLKKTQIWKYVK